MPVTSHKNLAQRLDGRALIGGERRALAVIVALTAIGTLAEAGFLVLVARSGIALATGADSVTLVRDISLSTVWVLALSAALVVLRFGTSCLLYTSPSPRDGLLSRMPSSA